MRDGTLERIYRKWNIWDESQAAFFQRASRDARRRKSPRPVLRAGVPCLALRYFPSLLRAAAITLALSCAAMALAVLLGIGIAAGRIYGGVPARALTGYVGSSEDAAAPPALRPLLRPLGGRALPAFAAALLGLGLNYAAYESEIYRGALEAVSRVQLEAARTLGLTEWLILRLVRGRRPFASPWRP
jgi:polar amino acid transport system substrate-binding protein